MSHELTEEQKEQQRVLAEERRSTIQGFRDLAQFLEDRPQVPVPIYPSLICHIAHASVFADIARIMGGEKNPNGEWYGLRRNFGPVSYEIYIQREKVCTKTVIREEYVPGYTREICEWECHDSILAEREKQGVL